MNKLFDENERYTQTATDFENEVHLAIGPIFERYLTLGYSPRELSYLIMQTANDLGLSAILGMEKK